MKNIYICMVGQDYGHDTIAGVYSTLKLAKQNSEMASNQWDRSRIERWTMGKDRGKWTLMWTRVRGTDAWAIWTICKGVPYQRTQALRNTHSKGAL